MRAIESNRKRNIRAQVITLGEMGTRHLIRKDGETNIEGEEDK